MSDDDNVVDRLASMPPPPPAPRWAAGHENGDSQQLDLIPMTDAEMRAAGRELAELCLREADMAKTHRAARKAMTDERIALREQIETVATSLRKQGR